ncbi:putative Ig domain-containing protein [Chelativorans petroleitrophicus]|uniref:putative Ig domain-containing protein n=1 Tax=Chelativorans petroleitrophicus TaxID=2975484 RepID=UPI00311B3C0E
MALDVPSPFGLTVNQGVSIGLTVEDGNEGLTFRQAEGSFMPGLSVNAATGAVSGTPDAPAGTEFAIAVEAVRNGFVVGVTQTLSRILRDPIDIDVAPESVRLATGEPLPMTVFGAVGGDQDTIGWSLQNAPDWLDIQASGPGQAVLAVASGHEAAATPKGR